MLYINYTQYFDIVVFTTKVSGKHEISKKIWSTSKNLVLWLYVSDCLSNVLTKIKTINFDYTKKASVVIAYFVIIVATGRQKSLRCSFFFPLIFYTAANTEVISVSINTLVAIQNADKVGNLQIKSIFMSFQFPITLEMP